MMSEDDKVTLAQKRAELVASLAAPLSVEDRVRIQGELGIVNAKIKALNTTEAARLKAAADQRRVAGMAEARANADRAQAKQQTFAPGVPGVPGHGDQVDREQDETDDDPAQIAAIDAWVEAVLRRGGVKVHRASDGNLDLVDAPAKWVAIIDALCSGIYAAARGQELPEVTAAPKEKRKTRR